MRKLTVTTCGTSILTNGQGRDDIAFLHANANRSESEYTQEERERLLAIADKKRDILLDERDEAQIRRLSAELNGFIGSYRRDGELSDAAGDMHYLICTDTFQGKLTADIIEKWGWSRGFNNMNAYPIEDLNTNSMSSFQLGVNNLVEWCDSTLPGHRESGDKIMFNLVGGFKALQGYMQALGMFYADEIIYIFENSSEILSIPKLPFDLEQSAKQKIKDNLNVVRLLLWKSLKVAECKNLPESMLQIIDDECCLSAWGRIMFSRVVDEIYGERLLPPSSKLVRISKNTEDQTSKQTTEKIIMINKAIDNLSRFMETGRKHNLRSFNIRTLKGEGLEKKHPSTHEFNLWSTEQGWRGFCHFENGQREVVVDSIDIGLGH